MNKKILLLNPPGKFRYLRDYYCSSISKAGYYWHPIDLLILSGYLHEKYEINVIDCIAESLNADDCYNRIKEIVPDVVIFLSSVLSYEEDIQFIKRIKELKNIKTIGCGEIFLQAPHKTLADNPHVDAVILDFTNKDILDFIEYSSRYDNILPFGKNYGEYFRIPLPRHEKFPLSRYRYPCSRSHPFASVLTNYGCPYKCHFCNSGNLGFKIREIDNVIGELKYIKELGISQIFIKDMTFGADREHALEFCKAIVKEGVEIQWNCYARIDTVDEELIRYMKEAGCYLIQFGIENIDDKLTEKYGKKIAISRVNEVFKMLRKQKILTGAHFLFGLPEEPAGSAKESMAFSRKIRPDYVSYNIYSPRKGSSLAAQAPAGQNSQLRNCINKGYFRFYLRPGYIFSRLSKIRSFYELKNLLYMGKMLASNIIKDRI
ncbi:B12-binding domain-containing radical SAM protein [Elusimicrobiota bacterium]